ncbi:MAG: CpXC domain-containing protein [Syntrophomonadaceae bacterium]
MSIINRNEYDCPNCSHKLSINVYDSINVGINPELKDLVLAGKLNSAVCPECDKRIVINQSFMYHDPKNLLIINHVPKHADPYEVVESSKLFSLFAGYMLRYVTRLPELTEKIKLSDNNLNDIAVQLLKINLFRNEDLNQNNSIKDIDFLLFEEDTLIFQVVFKDGSGQIISISHAAYLQIYESLVQLNLLDRDKDRCICVNDEYIMDLLKDYL